MESYNYLLALAIILLTTKLLSLITRRFNMPQVVGALLAGLLIGPSVLGIVQETDFLDQVAEIGLIVLMFGAGLETDIKELKKAGKASAIIATIGVLVPLAGGFFVAWFFNRPGMIDSTATTPIFLQNLFIGVILTATSVSITVETLKEMGKLNTRAGNAILGAAVIDDILGIVALTIITSFTDSSVNIGIVLLKILLFFVFVAVVGFGFYYLFNRWTAAYEKDMRRFVITAFVFCLVISYCAETLFGVADITGAYLAGLMISSTQHSKYIMRRFDILSYMFLSPIFFASIGLKVVLPPMTSAIILFSVSLAVIAILTKVVGCGIGAKICKYTNKEAIQIGAGMVSRGEVALIVATKGDKMGLMSDNLMGPIIIVVVITTIISPILLALVFKEKKSEETEVLVGENSYAAHYDDVQNLKKLDIMKFMKRK